jgi:pyruvate dehydrogenase E1 component
LEAVSYISGKQRATDLLAVVHQRAEEIGIDVPFNANTPYINTISLEEQPAFPGNREIERKVKSLVRWNAMAMVLKANDTTNVGGHIGTFASSANLYEVGFNHFSGPGSRVRWGSGVLPGTRLAWNVRSGLS